MMVYTSTMMVYTSLYSDNNGNLNMILLSPFSSKGHGIEKTKQSPDGGWHAQLMTNLVGPSAIFEPEPDFDTARNWEKTKNIQLEHILRRKQIHNTHL